MALITESDTYSPPLNQEGIYIDHIPSFGHFKDGLICPCSKLCYKTRAAFVSHSKTVGHKKWIDALNANRHNHFTELEQSRKLVKQQQMIIAQLEIDKIEMMNMVSFLSRQLAERNNAATQPMIDLLDFN
jgi:hypothetical protein